MNSSFSPSEILHIIFKHKAFIKGFFITLVFATVIGAFMQPTNYRAAGRILITGQEGGYTWMSLDDSARVPPEDPDRFINTEIEHLKGDDFLEKVAETLPFSLAADASTEDQGTTQNTLMAISKRVNTVANFPSRLGALFSSVHAEKDLDGKKSDLSGKPRNPSLWPLRRGLEAIPIPNTSLIEIAFTDKNPQHAAKVVNTILDLYPAYRVKMYHDDSAISFYDKQKQTLERDINHLKKNKLTNLRQKKISPLSPISGNRFLSYC